TPVASAAQMPTSTAVVRTRLIHVLLFAAALLPKEPLSSQCSTFRPKVNRRAGFRAARAFRWRPARLQSARRATDIRCINRDHPFLQPGTLLRVLPTGAVVGVAWALAWRTNGSIDAGDWLPYA